LPTKPAWFEVFGVNEADIKAVCEMILKLYARKIPNQEELEEVIENLRKEYADSIQRMRNLVDEAIDTIAFIKASGNLRLLYKSSDDLTFNINTYRGGY